MSNKSDKLKKNVLFRLIKYIKPHWYLILISTIAGVIKLFLPLILPQTVKYFTDNLLLSNLSAAKKGDEIIRILLFLILIYIFIYIPASYFRNMGATEAGNRIMHTLRCEVFAHLQKMSANFHHENKSGDLVTRINNDVDAVYGFIWNIATNIWIDTIMIAIYIFLMLSLNPILTVIAGISLPISVIATKKIRARMKKHSRKLQDDYSSISGYMQERMAGYATVKAFGLEKYENAKFSKHSYDIYRYSHKVNQLFVLGDSINSSAMEIVSSVIVCLSALFITKQQMSIGDLICFYLYLGYFITPIKRFSEITVEYAKSIAGIERVFEILDTKEDIKPTENPLNLSDTISADHHMNIEFNKVYFKYDNAQTDYTLSDINFKINDGECIALVGSSGCGKTTLISLLARFYDVTEGSITINNHNIKEYSLESLYENIGMVSQDICLFSESIGENIRLGKLSASTAEIESAAQAANALTFITNTENSFDTLLGERGIGLSGGQKQRIAIARVFLKNPRILILDEATSALDSESEILIQKSLDQLMAGRTSIIIAHRLSTIINADKIMVMDKGRIVEAGKHDELLHKNGRYAELYRLQFRNVIG